MTLRTIGNTTSAWSRFWRRRRDESTRCVLAASVRPRPKGVAERRYTWPGGDTGSMTFSATDSKTASGIKSETFLQTMRTGTTTTLAMTLTISTAVRSMPSCDGEQREEDNHEDASTGGH